MTTPQEIPDWAMREARALWNTLGPTDGYSSVDRIVSQLARALLARDTAARKECTEIARRIAEDHEDGRDACLSDKFRSGTLVSWQDYARLQEQIEAVTRELDAEKSTCDVMTDALKQAQARAEAAEAQLACLLRSNTKMKVPTRTVSPLLRALFSALDADRKSYAALARVVGISPVTLSRWKAGVATPVLTLFEYVVEAAGYQLTLTKKEQDGQK